MREFESVNPAFSRHMINNKYQSEAKTKNVKETLNKQKTLQTVTETKIRQFQIGKNGQKLM